jgi:hypothetical protein
VKDVDRIVFIVKGKAKSILNKRSRDVAKRDVIFVPEATVPLNCFRRLWSFGDFVRHRILFISGALICCCVSGRSLFANSTVEYRILSAPKVGRANKRVSPNM